MSLPANPDALAKGLVPGGRSAEHQRVFQRLKARMHRYAAAVAKRKFELECEVARDREEREIIWRKMGL